MADGSFYCYDEFVGDTPGSLAGTPVDVSRINGVDFPKVWSGAGTKYADGVGTNSYTAPEYPNQLDVDVGFVALDLSFRMVTDGQIQASGNAFEVLGVVGKRITLQVQVEADNLFVYALSQVPGEVRYDSLYTTPHTWADDGLEHRVVVRLTPGGVYRVWVDGAEIPTDQLGGATTGIFATYVTNAYKNLYLATNGARVTKYGFFINEEPDVGPDPEPVVSSFWTGFVNTREVL